MESEPWIDELLLFQHSLWFQVIPGRRRLGRCRKNCQRKKPSPSLWQRWMKWHVSLNDFVWCAYEWVCGCLCLSCMSVVFCLVFCCLSRLSPFDNCWLCACNTVFFCWLWNTLSALENWKEEALSFFSGSSRNPFWFTFFNPVHFFFHLMFFNHAHFLLPLCAKCNPHGLISFCAGSQAALSL